MDLATQIIALITAIIGLIAIIKTSNPIKPKSENKDITKSDAPEIIKKGLGSVILAGFIILSSIAGIMYFIWVRTESPVTTKDLGFIALLITNYIAGYFFLRTVKLH